MIVRDEYLGWVMVGRIPQNGIDYYGVTFDHLVPPNDLDPEVLQININEMDDDNGEYANTYALFQVDPEEYIGKKILAIHRCCQKRKGTQDRSRVNWSVEKPVIVLIHGPWQTAAQWQPLADGLKSDGFTVLQPQNATSGPDAAAIRGKTYRDDVEVIRLAIEPHLTAGKAIVFVCHSYGGVPASAAADGLQVQDRRALGLTGGVKHIVYLAAFASPVKEISLLMALGGAYAPFMDNKGDVITLGEGAKDALYNDTEPELAAQLLAANFKQSTASFETPQTFAAADVSVPKTYVIAEEDHALPVQAQEGMSQALNDVSVVRLPFGHCMHLNPKALPKLIETIQSAAKV
ncbi:hypothetical protein KVR01_004840 [Diaporthe batatas]|uniref:uncharacterized protein n=1 Tax=Diaporthe batatas TaxID=748121 RepID=UPI001D054D38|nr:uncharacterized protein KVR01_004840 [Diaporthe batatas]KAG8166288.1 hypothetical protein KVR01_004840 [Diaporthe batatas]